MSNLSVYIAGPYAARELLARCGAELSQIGYKVTARWLKGEHEPQNGGDEGTTEERNSWARMDLSDVDCADVLVAFTAAAAFAAGKGVSGGRHIETGYALAKGKRVVLIGEPENIFHSLHEVTCVPDWHDALILLAAEIVRHERGMPRAVSSAERAS